jgi:hypothetical protein
MRDLIIKHVSLENAVVVSDLRRSVASIVPLAI